MIDLEYEHGRLIAVDEVPLGSALAAAVLAGATTITVDDAADFDEDGGTIQIAGVQYAYESCDDDTGDIVLVDPLEADADEGDTVDVYDTLRQVVSTEKVCLVELDGEDENVDPLEATLAHYLANDVPEGIRPTGQGESVRIALDGDELLIVDVLGLANDEATGVQFFQDAHTVKAPGAQTFTLTHEPEQDSEHLYVNGIEYDESEGWSRDGTTISVVDGLLRIDDLVKVEYARFEGASIEGASIEVLVPFGATGWSYKQITSTDSTDYSGAGYDDSAWSVGQAAFGGNTALPVSNGWAYNTRLWLRRSFAGATDVSIHVKVEDNATVYVNGNLVGATGSAGAGSIVNIDPGVIFDVPAAFLNPAENVLAIRCDDEYGDPGGIDDQTYADIQVTGRLL